MLYDKIIRGSAVYVKIFSGLPKTVKVRQEAIPDISEKTGTTAGLSLVLFLSGKSGKIQKQRREKLIGRKVDKYSMFVRYIHRVWMKEVCFKRI